MNLETLKLFCNVVRCQSFSRGAAMNHVSQSAASQAVHQLERLYDVQLIDRTKRPFIVTPEGLACYEGFRDILDRFETIEVTVRSLRQEISGVVRVAAIYSIGLYDMSKCMQEFMSLYPKAKVRLQYLRPNKVYEAVLNEEVDLGVMSYPSNMRGLTIIPLRNEKMVLVCNPQHRLANMDRVLIGQLRGESFIGFDRDLNIRKELDRCFRKHEVIIDMSMEFDNIETIKQAIEIGVGISILPEPTVRNEVQAGTLAMVPLAITDLQRPLGIIHRHRKMFNPTIIKFIELLKSLEGNSTGTKKNKDKRKSKSKAQSSSATRE
jgi:DNA-binding transcriptional LysR family regulator